jgi:hypothetical protein
MIALSVAKSVGTLAQPVRGTIAAMQKEREIASLAVSASAQ